MNKCCICNREFSEEIIDNICDDCEVVWLGSLGKIAKTAKNDTEIHSLFQSAAEDAKKIIAEKQKDTS